MNTADYILGESGQTSIERKPITVSTTVTKSPRHSSANEVNASGHAETKKEDATSSIGETTKGNNDSASPNVTDNTKDQAVDRDINPDLAERYETYEEQKEIPADRSEEYNQNDDRKEVSETRSPRQRMSYVDLFKSMNPHRPESDEDRAKREKRAKREALFAAIGDGISAFSNLFFTSKGAPNAFNADNSMSARGRERLERLRREREAKDRDYFEGYMRALSMDEANDREDRNWRHMLEQEKRSEDRQDRQDARADQKEARAERKAEQDEQMFQVKLLLQQGKLTEQGYRNAVAEIKAGKFAELTQAQIDKLNRTGNGGGGHGRSSGGGTSGKWAYYGPDGKVLGHVQTKDEAIRQTELNGGTYPALMTETERTTTDQRGKQTKTTSKSKKSSAVSGTGNRWSNTAKIKW